MVTVRRLALTACLALVTVLSGIGSAHAASPTEIRSLTSTVTVFPSGDVEVREQLTLVSSGESITRLLPQDVQSVRPGSRATPSWRIKRAIIDGHAVAWQLRATSPSRLTLEVGSGLAPGLHTLDLDFITDRFVTASAAGAALSWDATGAWQAPIAQASVLIVPPPGAGHSLLGAGGSLQNAVGRIGSLPATTDMDGMITIRPEGPLGAGERLVVHASWPPGVVHTPSLGMRIDWFVRDWGGIVMGLFGLLVLAGYFQSAWAAVGKDPAQGAVIPQFTPPEGMSPAVMRYVRHMTFDDTCFAANLLDLGARGALTVTQDGAAIILHHSSAPPAPLPPDEQAMLEHLFGSGPGTLVIGPSAQPVLQAAKEALQQDLDTRVRSAYFDLHQRETLTGIGISFVTAVIAGMAQATTRASALAYLCLLAWLLIWSAAVAFAWSRLVRSLKTGRSHRHAKPSSLWEAFTSDMAWTSQEQVQRTNTSMLAYAVLFWMAGAGVFFRIATIPVASLVVAMAVVDIVYGHIMPSWTPRGRQAADDADGFALYLKVAEQPRMDWFTPPARTPELLQRYLPYALALGVEQEWAEQFRDTVGQSTSSATA